MTLLKLLERFNVQLLPEEGPNVYSSSLCCLDVTKCYTKCDDGRIQNCTNSSVLDSHFFLKIQSSWKGMDSHSGFICYSGSAEDYGVEVSMQYSMIISLISALLLASMVIGDDKDADKKEKLSKIPPLTLIGYQEGEIVQVEGGDRLILKTREIVPQWVNNLGANQGTAAGRINNRVNFRTNMNGGGYVAKEQIKDIPLNLSPDLKVRIMYSTQLEDKKDNTLKNKKSKSLREKELAEKDPDFKLGGTAGTKSQLAKGQWVRIAVGRNNDLVNPQIYGMVVFVLREGR